MTLLTAGLVILISYSLYTPLPSEINEPGLARTYIAAFKTANFLAYTVELFTTFHHVNVIRWLVNVVYSPVLTRYSDITVENLNFNGIPVRLYRPSSVTDLTPCIVYFHGGGWILFSVDTYDLLTSELSRSTNTIVIAVDYRKPPEYPYPYPFDDCLRATQHVLQNGQQYLIDVNRVAVAGDGAGGNLAAAVALRLSEEDPTYTPHIKLQVLIQPALQALSFDTPSYRQNAVNTLVGRTQMILFWCHYLDVQPTQGTINSFQSNQHLSPSIKNSIYSLYISELQLPECIKINYIPSSLARHCPDYDKQLAQKLESKVVDPFLSPLMADNLSKLPRAYVLVSEYDVLRDDGLLYASRLRQANVPVVLRYVRDQMQGFMAPAMFSDYFKFTAANVTWYEVYEYINLNL
ncbi:unnamed protein product [Lymnaea stagnalis]|uniref:Alpha/beta hydrolase fold-3 domain-containing protein n=1 Tax=Lymnaea stagnalis TaxID=6523 RepID=A0AAV2H4T6_LYMST